MNFLYWLPIATKELFMQFSVKSQPTNRDFLWLTLLSMLVLLFALLMLSTREGLSERMVDLLLGRVPGHGIPVWVRANPYTAGGKNLIDSAIVNRVNEMGQFQNHSNPDQFPHIPGLRIYPYQEVDHVSLSLPGENIWHSHPHDPESPRFEGIAVTSLDPLWLFAMNVNAPDNFTIVLNKSIIKNYLKYDIYRDHLKTVLPSPLFQQVPQKENFFLANKTQIWLLVGAAKDLLRLDVIWMDQFPIPGKFAYLFAWHHYQALEKAYQYSNIRYFPEIDHDQAQHRVKSLFLKQQLTSEKRNQLAQCLNGQIEKKRRQFFLTFQRPVPSFWVDACIDDIDMDPSLIRIAHPVTGDTIQLKSFDRIALPCGKLPRDVLTGDAQKACQNNPKHPFEEILPGAPRAFVYVPDRGQLNTAIANLKNMDQKPLLIPWIYADALKRFGALIRIIDVLSSPYLVLFLLFLVALFGVMIATLIGHRKHYYGIYLAKGMRRCHIYGMLIFQTGMTLVIGLFGAAISLQIVRYLINGHFIAASKSFSDVLPLKTPDLLPISFQNHLLYLLPHFWSPGC
ncbi:MAG: hypothetical protein OMM_07490 [Candidatus Magnetoglobus multicellularis str. Araruama]|uniref:Uncharacterized protein n=1 Tax=Candidatus Magnetoglobus multicellularis str. Araruama TaxID=890399 RepID=A0A1V1PCH2_9BACT|nr:MAG: hypothetical protein OMM_07490 [Candidatus Magnetoglobus multicellularis str. Araruama]